MATQNGLFSQQTPTGLVIAQTVGITASLFLLGSNASLSFVAVPAVMKAPAPLAANQWYTVLTHGGAIGRPLAILSAIATGYVAYHQDPSSTPFKLNIAATVLLPSIVPFTLAFIVPTNNKLIAKKDELASASLDDKAAEAGVAQDETVHALIDRWATLNLARAVLVGAGALCAVLAAVNKREVVGFKDIGLASGANRLG
ncbi:Nn.00g027630.m01.CDS01 [Neocucurbitaria sp. VM-36]